MTKKKMIIILSSVVSAIILIIGGIVLFTILKNQNSTFSQIEDKMVIAAERYYKKNKDRLPIEEKTEVTIEIETLVTEKYMDELSKFLKKGVSCSGGVTVKKNVDIYIYSPRLDCGEAYTTKNFSEVIKEKKDLSDNGSGLYEMNNEYVFRGENPNNYVKFANQLWRIVKIDKDGDISLISYNNSISKTSYQWDNRFNVEKNSEVGINDYQLSRVRESLVAYINDPKIFSEKDSSKIVAKNICVGARGITQEGNDGSIECAKVIDSEKVGLITTYDFLRTSTDQNCKKTTDYSCQNYNYLVKMGNSISTTSYWTLNASSEDTFNVYRVYVGYLSPQRASSSASIRPVIYLHNKVMISGGTGTEELPYIIK